MGSGLTNTTTTLPFLSPGGRGSLPLLINFERQARRGGYPTTLPFVPSRHQSSPFIALATKGYDLTRGRGDNM